MKETRLAAHVGWFGEPARAAESMNGARFGHDQNSWAAGGRDR
jgi:hypothetical protein